MMPSHEAFMSRALELAGRGRGRVKTNPMVGAVLVREGRIVAEGWHQYWGGDHAEVVAIKSLDQSMGYMVEDLSDYTMYVTLEPCCHHGKTPPCTDALIGRSLGRCVVAMVDPNPRVSGQGIELLRNHGTEVILGVGALEAVELNRGFIRIMDQGRPFISLKMAVSLDGKIAAHDGSSQWISNPSARLLGRSLRTQHDAIMVGISTWLHDAPKLEAVSPLGGPQPTIIILDPQAKSLKNLLGQPCMNRSVVIVVNGEPSGVTTQGLPPHVQVLNLQTQAGAGAFSPMELVKALVDLGISSVLIEGGGKTLGPFIEAGIWDSMDVFLAPILIGSRGRPAFVVDRGTSIKSAQDLECASLEIIENNAHFKFTNHQYTGGQPCLQVS